MKLKVSDVLTGAVQLGTDVLSIDNEISVKKGTEGWVFVVAHIVDVSDGFSLENLLGEPVSLDVDVQHRRSLSAAHSACHISALALNKCTTQFWRKEVAKDSLGNPNLDQLAIQISKITTSESFDQYRFGKSIRKQGLESAALLEQVKVVEACVNQQLERWLKTGARIYVEAPEAKLEARRWWKCELPEGTAQIPCGGTHIADLNELASIQVSYEVSSGVPEMSVHTVPTLPA
jgi:alanyl-tRNA synthetase